MWTFHFCELSVCLWEMVSDVKQVSTCSTWDRNKQHPFPHEVTFLYLKRKLSSMTCNYSILPKQKKSENEHWVSTRIISVKVGIGSERRREGTQRWKKHVVLCQHHFLALEPPSCILGIPESQDELCVTLYFLPLSQFSLSLITDCQSLWPNWTYNT